MPGGPVRPPGAGGPMPGGIPGRPPVGMVPPLPPGIPSGPVRPPRPPWGIGRIIRLILIAILSGVGMLLGAAIVGIILLFRDVSPPVCAARSAAPSTAASQQLRAAWRTFGAQAAAGPATITVSEVQATSRGVEFVNEQDAPVKNLQIRFCDGGFAEAAGSVKILGREVDTVVRGTLDLSGPRPRVRLTSVRAGGLPDWAGRPLVNQVLDTGGLRTLPIKEHLTSITYTGTSATIQGAP